MQIIKATGLDRKSGGSPSTAFRFRLPVVPFKTWIFRLGPFARRNPGLKSEGHPLKVWRLQLVRLSKSSGEV
jgi:hypothetical protein